MFLNFKQLQKVHKPQFIVPLGVSHFFKKLGIENVIEIDWDEEFEFKSIKIKGTPAVHFLAEDYLIEIKPFGVVI